MNRRLKQLVAGVLTMFTLLGLIVSPVIAREKNPSISISLTSLMTDDVINQLSVLNFEVEKTHVL